MMSERRLERSVFWLEMQEDLCVLAFTCPVPAGLFEKDQTSRRRLACVVFLQVDANEIDLLYSNVQSGESFDLRASAQPTNENLSQTEGTIVMSLGVKYKELCAALARTLLLNGTKVRDVTRDRPGPTCLIVFATPDVCARAGTADIHVSISQGAFASGA